MAEKVKKPFNVKGTNIVSFLGESEWCKILPKQMETRFTPKGQYSVTLIANPEAEDYIEFTTKVKAIIDTAVAETMADEGAMKVPKSKKDKIIVAYPWKNHFIKEKDDDGNWTIEIDNGMMSIQPKMKNIMDKPQGRNEVILMGANNTKISLDVAPELGNGSKIKAKMFVNPYYMPSTNTIGVSLNLSAIKLYELVEYGTGGGGEDFDADDGGEDIAVSEAVSDEEDF